MLLYYKILRKFSLLVVAIFLQIFSYGQTVNKYHQDGLVIFQFNTSKDIIIPTKNERIIDHNSLVFLRDITEKFEIQSVYYLHPGIDDENLNNTVEISFNNIYEAGALISYLRSFDFIEYAEPKSLHYPLFTPDDAYYSVEQQWGLFKINASEAWDIHTGSPEIIVAVPDDAFKTDHPDLVNKFLPGWDAAENTNDPGPAGEATGWHGTMVAGVAGAETNNGIGIASIGFDVSLLPIKIARNSDGALVAGYDGVIWAAQNGANVINMSWGGGSAGQYGQNIVNFAWNQGAILVAGAGNGNTSTEFYPAAYNNVIAVAATNSDDVKASVSHFGNWIGISAPGEAILSCNHNNTYTSSTGTSLSSPFVAGLLGLMLSASPELTRDDIINCLFESADNIDEQNPQHIGQLGHGRINAHQAMLCVTVYNDAGITEIIEPRGGNCQNGLEPVVMLHNFGAIELISVNINYQVSGEDLMTYQWTGNLAQGESEIVNLPPIILEPGQYTFNVYTSEPNGAEDMIPENDGQTSIFRIYETGEPLPYSENFEIGIMDFTLFKITNPDHDISWDIYEISGTSPGNKAAGIKLFDYQNTEQRDGLQTPPLDFSQHESIFMSFEHAYTQHLQNETDSLIIYVSTDCGASFERIFEIGEDGTGNFSTAPFSTQNFIPQSASDWCVEGDFASCFTLDLSQFSGNENIIIKFESYNNNGNNLYIDNINVFTDIPSFVCSNDIDFEVFPNPAEDFLTIKISGDDEKFIQITDLTGRTVKSLKSKDEYIDLDVSQLAKGMYIISIFHINRYITEKILIK